MIKFWHSTLMRVFLIVLGCFILLAGCNKDPLPKYQTQIQAKIDAIKGLSSKLLPPLSSDTLTFDGPLEELRLTALGQRNMAVFGTEDLLSFGSISRDASIFELDRDIHYFTEWAAKGSIPREMSSETAELMIKNFLLLDKVLIIKKVKWETPIRKDQEFVSGSYIGEAHLYDLSGKYYGGVRFQAVNAEKVLYTQHMRGQEVRRDDAVFALDDDLKRKAWAALTAAIKNKVPSVIFNSR